MGIKETINKLRSKNKRSEDKMDIEEVNNSVHKKLDQITGDVGCLSGVAKKVDFISGKVEESVKQLSNLDGVGGKLDNLDGVAGKVDTAITKLDNLDGVAGTLTDVSNKLNEVTSTQLPTMNDSIHGKLDYISDQTTKLEDISTQVGKLDNISNQVLKLNKISAQVDKLDDIYEQVGDVQFAVSSEIKELDTSLSGKLVALTETVTNLATSLDKLQNEKTTLQNEKITLQEEKNNLQAMIDQLQSVKGNLEGEVAGLNQKIQGLEQTVSDLSAQSGKWEASAKEWEGKSNQFEATTKEQSSEISMLKGEVSATADKLSQQKEAFSDFKQETNAEFGDVGDVVAPYMNIAEKVLACASTKDIMSSYLPLDKTGNKIKFIGLMGAEKSFAQEIYNAMKKYKATEKSTITPEEQDLFSTLNAFYQERDGIEFDILVVPEDSGKFNKIQHQDMDKPGTTAFRQYTEVYVPIIMKDEKNVGFRGVVKAKS